MQWRCGLAIGLAVALAAGQSASAADAIDYLQHIKPVLKARCYACHGALKQKSGLRLDTAESLRRGGESGSAAAAGNAAGSLIIERLRASLDEGRMPPEGKPLEPAEIDAIARWIDRGAIVPPSEVAEEDPARHWAFQRPLRPASPEVKDSAWVRNPIDAFVAAQHEGRGLKRAPEASKPVLLRRVYLDLTGLPPSRAELHAFVADSSPDAYDKIVEQLLASPRYGERWARHWMDVWRYSDWYGRRGVPDVWNSAPQIWRWRDWIIHSLNADKGYDRMLTEMLAADEVAPTDDEAAVATGYLVRNWYALNHHQWMRDLVEHTGKAFLGLTFNCAQCHDHKYDPIAQEEYFRFRAFFEPLGLRQDRVAGEADPGPFQKYEYTVLRKLVELGSVRVLDEQPAAPTLMYSMGDERNVIPDRPPITPGMPKSLGGDKLPIEQVSLPPTAWNPALKDWVQRDTVADCNAAIAAATKNLAQARVVVNSLTDEHEQARYDAAAFGVRTSEAELALATAQLVAAEARIVATNAKQSGAADAAVLAIAAVKAERAAAVGTQQVAHAKAEASLDALRQKTDTDDKHKAAVQKAEVQLAAAAKALEAARTAQAQEIAPEAAKFTPLSPVYPDTSTGRRRALAGWIASRDNPLTARVAVNHIWLRHFGRPLVDSVYDFGRNGKRPSHPELLDWLAVELMGSGWSMKQIHRRIVLSSTYRMHSEAGADAESNRASDPDNRFLWQFPTTRMQAETIRDSVLSIAGQLDGTIGGRSLDNTQEATSHRRSMYFSIFPEGGGVMRFMEVFDAPDTCDCYRRTQTVMPQQALAMSNSQLILEQSGALARNLWQSVTAVAGPSNDYAREPAFVTAAFEQVLTRGPSEREATLCREFLQNQIKLYAQEATAMPESAARARESLIRALLSHNDFVTIR